jgi:cytosine/adenosine deaminase-related metal-dependent hydrolase
VCDLIKGGCVLTLVGALGDFEQADVLVEGGKISAVRPTSVAPNAEVIDATRMIVMPGSSIPIAYCGRAFCATSSPTARSRITANVVQRTFGAKYIRPTTSMPAICFSALGAIDSGVTCVLDWSHIHNTPETSDAAVKALGGVRRARGVCLWQSAERNRRYWEMQGHKYPEDIARLRKQYFSSDGPTAHALSWRRRRRPRADLRSAFKAAATWARGSRSMPASANSAQRSAREAQR